MSRWTALMPTALVGTDKHSGLDAALAQLHLGGAEAAAEHPAQLAWAQVITALRQQLQPDTAATVLLRAAACLDSVERAALRPEPPPEPLAPVALGAPDEHQAALQLGPWPERLQQVLTQGPPALQHEVMAALHQRGWRLPAKLLPLALELARSNPALRDAISAVVGERGRWLAQQSERWRETLSVPVNPTEDDWQHGHLAARLAFLRQERQRDPSAARERLQGALPELAAKERADLVPCLALALSADDEPLLQALLKDRAVDVRRWAGALLLRLPQSSHCQYMLAQITPLLQSQSAASGQDPNRQWVLESPASEDPAWKAHALDPNRPKHDALGERGWWLFQLVRGLPLRWWSVHTGMPPEALVAWATQTDWREALLRGWRDALALAPAEDHEDWAWALLGAVTQGAAGLDAPALRAMLSPARRAQTWAQQLSQEPTALWAIAQDILACSSPSDRLAPELSVALARAAVSQVRAELTAPQAALGYYARHLMLPLCAHLDPSALPLATQLGPLTDPPPAYVELQAQLMRLHALRTALSQLSPPPP
ncbi:MAG: DUF5691 domain-containing protein [Ideonella sp.]|nr:DUF5691 domain-containing protein [Ideonella sp.]